MRKIDKLIRQVGKTIKNKGYGVHIVERGWCYSCKEKCKYATQDKVTKVSDEIEVISIDISYNGFKDTPTDTLINIVRCVDEKNN